MGEVKVVPSVVYWLAGWVGNHLVGWEGMLVPIDDS